MSCRGRLVAGHRVCQGGHGWRWRARRARARARGQAAQQGAGGRDGGRGLSGGAGRRFGRSGSRNGRGGDRRDGFRRLGDGGAGERQKGGRGQQFTLHVFIPDQTDVSRHLPAVASSRKD